jgi:hypothetical protein
MKNKEIYKQLTAFNFYSFTSFFIRFFAFYLTIVIGFCKINAYEMQCKMEEILTKKKKQRLKCNIRKT